MADLEAILQAYQEAGGDPSRLRSPRVASLVVHGHRVVGKNEIEGIKLVAEELPDGLRAKVIVSPGVRLDTPVHLCFGVIPQEGTQEILPEFEIGEGARAEFIAHCTFPHALRVVHRMVAKIHVGPGAEMAYRETHYHGREGGVEVVARAEVTVEERGRFATEFTLVTGRVGKLDFDYAVDTAAHGLAEITTKVYGYGDDTIAVREAVRLNGEGARGLVKSRIAVRERAQSKVVAVTEGRAPLARGHVDCIEIVRDEAIAEAVPMVKVTDPRAYVTHEAAIGTVNRKELETLMARGLDEEAAVDVIIRGMLGR